MRKVREGAACSDYVKTPEFRLKQLNPLAISPKGFFFLELNFFVCSEVHFL